MIRKFYLSIIAAIFIGSFSIKASGQDSALGLYHPDFEALQKLFGLTGIPTLPRNKDLDKVIEAWGNITFAGRQLILKERALALVVVTPEGQWMYRTPGIYSLRFLHTNKDHLNKSDVKNLEKVLDYKWFQELRDHISKRLFSGIGIKLSTKSTEFGLLLSRIEQIEGSKAEKDWFRSLIGDEILDLDEQTRATLMQDSTYGKSISDAILLAQKTKEAQLGWISDAIDGKSISQIPIGNIAFRIPKWREEIEALGVLGASNVEGKDIFTWKTSGGTLFLALTANTTDWHLDFTEAKLTDLLINNKAKVFVGAQGTSTIYEVKVVAPVPARVR